MRAFLIGLIFLIGVAILAGVGVLLFPLLMLMVWSLRFMVIVFLFIFAVWILGKFIIFIWETIKKK